MRPRVDAAVAERLRHDALDLLDYAQVREAVAGHTRFLPARHLASKMAPSYDGAEVAGLQSETSEGLRVLGEVGDIDLTTSEDVSSAVARAALDGVLTGLDLIAVTGLIEVLDQARTSLGGLGSDAPLLEGLVAAIPDLRDVQHRIQSSIGARGEVLDSATPSLGLLRRQVRQAYEDVAAGLDRVMSSDVGREVLQDQVISMRSDRLVVQVKSGLRHRVPGVVHGASNTGATLYIEPFATVEMGNAWRELVLEEERETERVLRELSAIVGAVADDLATGTELTARLDFILARARYCIALGVGEGTAQPPARDDATGPPARFWLLQARHPLLGPTAVPINVHIGPGWSVLVITGPNTGGKTAAMKMVGLLALMRQSGLRMPAEEGSSLPVFDGVYADIGDQQSIQESVSTFGSHMRNVISIMSLATRTSLVLLDELGTSTDPEEGSALAKAILGHLTSRGVTVIATTHHRTVAAFAEAAPGMSNASVELDAKTLRPTYHLTLGVPGRSYAMSIAEQLGLPDEVVEDARSLLEPQHLRFEDWLNELQEQRSSLKESLEAADRAQASAEATQRQVEERLREIDERRADIVQNIRGEVAAEYDDVRQKLRRAEAALSWRSPPGTAPRPVDPDEGVRDAGADLDVARDELRELERRARAAVRLAPQQPLAVGDLVNVRGLNVRGTVRSLPVQDEQAEVLIGDVRLRIDVERLSAAESPEEDGSEAADGIGYDLGPVISTTELDLRGMRAEEALIQVEEFLDKALRDGLSSVRIIHGKGTGVLRQAVRELLEHHPLARSFAAETPDRGGSGATSVELM